MTVALRGLWPISAISPTTAPAPIVATCSPPLDDARLALEHEEALDPDVALVDQDGAGLGIDGLTEGGDPRELGSSILANRAM